MPEVAIITDSSSCLPPDFLDRFGIDIIPINLMVGGKTYRDLVDISPSQAYELFLQDPASFKTSPATPEDCLAIFQNASRKSKNIFCISLSSQISVLTTVVRIARERARELLPETRIEVMDSGTTTAAEGFIVLAAARAAEAGKSLEQVIEAAERIKSRVHSIVLLETMRYVYRSGRVPKIAAQAASMLNIHPLFTVSERVRFVTATATMKHGIERMLRMMRDSAGRNPLHCAVIHAYAPEEAARLKERVAADFNTVELWTSEFSPVMGYATGTGTLGLAFYVDM